MILFYLVIIIFVCQSFLFYYIIDLLQVQTRNILDLSVSIKEQNNILLKLIKTLESESLNEDLQVIHTITDNISNFNIFTGENFCFLILSCSVIFLLYSFYPGPDFDSSELNDNIGLSLEKTSTFTNLLSSESDLPSFESYLKFHNLNNSTVNYPSLINDLEIVSETTNTVL